jgi:diguanylate cyclase (GGDEF)-like protein/PAS domain S-box-containing protein
MVSPGKEQRVPAFTPSVRISLCLVSIAMSSFMLALTWRPEDAQSIRVEQRKAFAEQLAIHCSLTVRNGDFATLKELLTESARGRPELLRGTVRTDAGDVVASVGEPSGGSNDAASTPQPASHVVPITNEGRPWGMLELTFQPGLGDGVRSWLSNPMLPFVLFFGLFCFLAFYLFVRQMFRQIDLSQSRVVPKRVRTTLNTLSEGVVILDKQGLIVLANDAFVRATGQPHAELLGQPISDLSWETAPDGSDPGGFPWERALESQESQVGAILKLESDDRKHSCILSVNSTPILGDDGSLRGVLASFDNLTQLEKTNVSLKQALDKLQQSRQEIQKQNQQLRDLATLDPLTGCLNRRAFFEAFESRWQEAEASGTPLSCLMVDLDHFKAINDNHGHSTGDRVLQALTAVLHENVRKHDLVCRYGGEEFCILLVGQDKEEAGRIAERLRKAVAAGRPADLDVTASVGVSSLCHQAKNTQELLDQADQALFMAKRTGRNRVVDWSQVPANESFAPEKGRPAPVPVREPIPYQAVSALLSALSYRHAETAEHSRRVADLCVALGRKTLTHNDCYALEMAALLHDIGKLGVPDQILLKPAALSPDEWKVLKTHEALGEEIVAASFHLPALAEIIRCHRLRYEGDSANPQAMKGGAIPLGARILKIVDAFDAMVSDQVYRKRYSFDDAFAELRRFAGTQFDPELVEMFVATVLDRDQTRNGAKSTSSTLQIGLLLERLAIAADQQDRATILQKTDSLEHLAAKRSDPELLCRVQHLRVAATTGADAESLTRMILELIEACQRK